MPFLVVPMAVPSLAFSASLSASSSRCHGRMQWQRASMNSLSVETPLSCRPSISPRTALRVDDHARPDHVDARRIQDARRDELQLVLFAARDDRVARVVAALAAHDQIGPARENIDELALALVAPLRAEDHLTWHEVFLPFLYWDA